MLEENTWYDTTTGTFDVHQYLTEMMYDHEDNELDLYNSMLSMTTRTKKPSPKMNKRHDQRRGRRELYLHVAEKTGNLRLFLQQNLCGGICTLTAHNQTMPDSFASFDVGFDTPTNNSFGS